ncbi:MAG TPA: cell division protein FtsZ, partial [Verrucomicrobiota bacterium]|nr:cell division protein FtsZ [Verrucomicrobiota bacterium]
MPHTPQPAVTAESPTPAPATRRHPAIRVLAVGGAGLQALEAMTRDPLEGVAFAAIHTDARAVAQCPLPEKILLGANLTRGLGTGGDPDLARAAAEVESTLLRELTATADLVIVVAGLGGGTGSGAAPVLARIARESGALVLALVALPFDFEGRRRQQQAQAALRQLKTSADAVLCLPNQKVARLLDENTSLLDTFRFTNDVLAAGLRGLWRLITRDGLINVDFADLCRVVRGRQAESCFATAEASGDNRARDVLDRLLASPFLDDGRLLATAQTLLVSLVGGPDLTLKDVSTAMEHLHRHCEQAQVVLGAAVDPAFAGRLEITLVATRKSDPDPNPNPTTEFNPPVSTFPTEPPDTPRAQPDPHPPSRYVAPPPQLSPEQAELRGRGDVAGGRV